MRNLIINRIKFFVEAANGKHYGADVEFKLGLNIIYGPNSVGKSSLVTGIIYCLGAEKSLGIYQNKQNPFKPEFYDKIENSIVTTSYILLEISNGLQTVTLARSVIKKTDVVGLKHCTIDNFRDISTTEYLIATGEGVFSDDGLQKFLFDFLNWKIVEVPSYDSGVVKLYFENLISLFFVEQRAGWSQIQARQIMRYGIRDVKKIVFEYLMGLDKFDVHLKEIERKEISERLYKLRNELNEKEENIVVVTNGKKDGEVLLIEKHGRSKGSIFDVIRLLEYEYEAGERELFNLGNNTQNIEERDNNLKDNLRRITFNIRKSTEKLNILLQEIASYENYIDRININKVKNKQLKKIEGIALELNISICPVCENPLPVHVESECKLCHQEIKRKISTPDENLEFLEDEKSSFEKILQSKKLELKKVKNELQQLKEKEKTISETIDHQIRTYIGPHFDKYRKKSNRIRYIAEGHYLTKKECREMGRLKSFKTEYKET